MQNKRTIRLFTGTYADGELFRYVYDEVKEDFASVSFSKHVEPENLHFTYHFIGDIDIEKPDEIKIALSLITKEYDSLLELRDISEYTTSACASYTCF
jgi:2'-5' RNA ligase